MRSHTIKNKTKQRRKTAYVNDTANTLTEICAYVQITTWVRPILQLG